MVKSGNKRGNTPAREPPDNGKNGQMTKITNLNLPALLKTPGRYRVGDGMFLKVLDEHRAYFVYRYRVDGREHEASLGSARKITLAEANNRHLAMLKSVRVDKRDPLADKRAAKASASNASAAAKPTFGECADHHIAAHAASWRNPKNEQQWRMTLTTYCAPIRSTPVDKVDTEAVLSVLKPLWMRAPETASRLRGRIEAVLASAQVDGHIHQDRTNPARWRGWLDRKLPNPKKIGERGHYTALPYADLPEFMARLGREPGTVAKALAFIVLTAARSGEALGMTWDEVDLATATWTMPDFANEGWQGARRAAQRSGAGDLARPVRDARQESARVPVALATSGAVERIAGAGAAAARDERDDAWHARFSFACGPRIRGSPSRSLSNALPTPSAQPWFRHISAVRCWSVVGR